MRAALLFLVGCHQTFGLVEVRLDPDASTADGALSSDLIAYYPMERITGNTLEDAAGTHDGSCQTSMCPTATAGAVGGALQFDGVASLIDVPGSVDLATTTGVTATIWAKLDVAPTVVRCAISKVYGGSGDNSWQICIDTQMRVVIYGSASASTLGGPITLGVWNHLAARWDAATQQLAVFINGVLGNDETETLAFDGSVLVIGGDRDDGGPTTFWPGALDEARIYNRALSDAEVEALATRD